ncbi:hypothetical protein SKAU_G00361410 [Synaphobranchus kaupii]|uniref:Uncharacterized protein n=1 Tax=Synaphobranchus kaupii TaxID=118154 RepID=A0A9Q1EIG7_SYNKA|nr:hypothetical protein SKAU_G00361410 [Synaphobranchus kaupii]
MQRRVIASPPPLTRSSHRINPRPLWLPARSRAGPGVSNFAPVERSLATPYGQWPPSYMLSPEAPGTVIERKFAPLSSKGLFCLGILLSPSAKRGFPPTAAYVTRGSDGTPSPAE